MNPDVDAKTHPYISTGLKSNKFGVAFEDARATYQAAAAMANLEVVGIDCHIGSQITEVAPYLDAVDKVLELVELQHRVKPWRRKHPPSLLNRRRHLRWPPLHLQPALAYLGYAEGDLPETEKASRENLCLPLWAGISDEQQAEVVSVLRRASELVRS